MLPLIIWLAVFLALVFFGAIAALKRGDTTVANVITGFLAFLLFVLSVTFAADISAQRKIEFEKVQNEIVSTKN